MAEEHPTLYPTIDRVSKGAHVEGMDAYEKMYKRSIEDSDGFWSDMGKQQVDWFRPFDTVSHGGFEKGDVAFYLGGQLNVSYNCLDRHVKNGKGDKVALLFEGDEPGDVQRITYKQLLAEVRITLVVCFFRR